jgi:hypothetical protein
LAECLAEHHRRSHKRVNMGQTFSGDSGSTNRAMARGALNATAGGLNAASGTVPPKPVDFSGIGTAIKKVRTPQPFTMNNPTTGVIPQNPNPMPGPDLNTPIASPMNPNPMPDLYSGDNAQIPRLRKPINGVLPFYGQ